MTPEEALGRIAFLLERALEPRYRVQAFRKAAGVVAGLPEEQLRARAAAGTLTALDGIGKVTATVITEALDGEVPVYLRRLEDLPDEPLDEAAASLRAALKGDLHSHSEWSDGGSPIRVMAETARALGHSYLALTDHSPRLRVANGLSAERLVKQLDVVEALNEELAPFRILTGIEVDILEDGTLDQRPELLDRLDIVVASVHSKLKMGERDMTRRMLRALEDPHVDVLGHVTGRLIKGERGRRGESQFDAARVFVECAEQGVAVEINSRPERLDPPKRLLRLAVEAGCRFSIDSDAHAPGQLDWQRNGCERAVRCGVTADRVINTLDAADLLKITHTART